VVDAGKRYTYINNKQCLPIAMILTRAKKPIYLIHSSRDEPIEAVPQPTGWHIGGSIFIGAPFFIYRAFY